MNLRERILAANDAEIKPVKVPEWDMTVYVRSMTAREREAWETEVLGRDVKNIRAKLLVKTACDETGALIFGEADIELLGEKSSKALERLARVAHRINAISEKDIEELKKS